MLGTFKERQGFIKMKICKKMIRYVSYGDKFLKFISIISVSFTVGFLLSVVASISILAKDSDSCIKLYDDLDSDVKSYVEELSINYEIPKQYIYGIAYNESRFQPDAINYNDDGTYDYGIMQINDSCFEFLHDEIGINSMTELFDVHTCIEAGVVILDYHKQVVGSDNLALLRYQMGEGAFNMILDEEISFPKSYYKTIGVINKYQKYFQNQLTAKDDSGTINT